MLTFGRMFVSPLTLILTAIPIVLFLLVCWIKLRNLRQIPYTFGICGNCRYDLTANESGRCPECGLECVILEEGAVYEQFRSYRRMQAGGLAVVLILIFGPEAIPLLLPGVMICAAYWLRHLPRFPLVRCQICGTSLLGAVDRRCPHCGIQAGLEAEQTLSEHAAANRRWCWLALSPTLLAAWLLLWGVSTAYRVRVETLNTWFTFERGVARFTNPAGESSRFVSVSFDSERLINTDQTWQERWGLTRPAAYSQYGASNVEIPMWLITPLPAIAAYFAWRALRKLRRRDRTVIAAIVPFPGLVRRALMVLGAIAILLLTFAASAAARGALFPVSS